MFLRKEFVMYICVCVCMHMKFCHGVVCYIHLIKLGFVFSIRIIHFNRSII